MLLTLEKKYRAKYYKLLDNVFDSGFWSEGKMIKSFESQFSMFIKTPSLAVSCGGGGLISIFEYLKIKNKEVIVPANTFAATVLAIKKAGGIPIFADCSKKDLCLSLSEIKNKITTNTKAICIVHIGGHLAFEIEEIASFCKKNRIALVEDCAHAHGATYKGKFAGSFGFAGAYSFYSTKTMPLGEGGMVCTNNKSFYKWLQAYRNYGKQKDGNSYKYVLNNGFNLRMNEVTAALGIIQLQRLPSILKWKRSLAKKYDQIFDQRIYIPDKMKSGYYKYIVFNCNASKTSGKVYSKKDILAFIQNSDFNKYPNTKWISNNHLCIPIHYKCIKLSISHNKLKKSLLN